MATDRQMLVQIRDLIDEHLDNSQWVSAHEAARQSNGLYTRRSIPKLIAEASTYGLIEGIHYRRGVARRKDCDYWLIKLPEFFRQVEANDELIGDRVRLRHRIR
jgi:hypothetical protein